MSAAPRDRIATTLRCAAAAAFALAAAAACTGASALSSMGTALVTAQDGQPCFGVPAADGARVTSLTVSAVEARSDWRQLPAELWGFTADPPGVASGGCIRYGAVPPGARAGDAAAAVLLPGRRYRVEIGARAAETRRYEADFCLVDREVRAVTWDEAAKRWRDEACPAGGR